MEGTHVHGMGGSPATRGLPRLAHVYLPVSTQMLSKHREEGEGTHFLFKL